MRRFLKKFTEGNARNSRLINCADVTTIRKTRVVWGRVSKIHARADTRVHIEHTATENMWFLRKERKPLLKPFIIIITVISRQLKKERCFLRST